MKSVAFKHVLKPFLKQEHVQCSNTTAVRLMLKGPEPLNVHVFVALLSSSSRALPRERNYDEYLTSHGAQVQLFCRRCAMLAWLLGTSTPVAAISAV